mgnify:CR=1 FL=1
MRTMITSSFGKLSVSVAALIGATMLVAQPAAAQAVRVDADDIGGVVTGAKGPEAGVWVIAETKDLPTKYVKIVATDDQGRYLRPDLPKGTYVFEYAVRVQLRGKYQSGVAEIQCMYAPEFNAHSESFVIDCGK